MAFVKGQPGGPGRPRKADKNAGAVARAEKQIRDRLPSLIDNMLHLADGGYERVEEEWQPAGSLWIGSGEFARPMYPELAPDELVLVKRKVSIADKDRAANIYLVDRIMGKPTERKELSGEVTTVNLTVEQWKAQAAKRREAAEQVADDEPA
jgi:hypothetical protein